MTEFIRITAKTPYNQEKHYVFLGDLSKDEEQNRLIKFMMDCCDDCADFYPCPDEYDIDQWRNDTAAMWEGVETVDTPKPREEFYKYDNPFIPPWKQID